MERTTFPPVGSGTPDGEPAASRVSRRTFLTQLSAPTLVAATGLLANAGCGPHRGAKTVVRFWNGFTGPDGRTMLRIIQKFNAENPDIEVLMQRMDWRTCYNKLFVAGLGGRAPELFVIHTRNMLRFARAGFLRHNDDLVAGANGIALDDIDANVWKGVELDGRHYGLPLDVHAMGMYYNRALFKEAGVPSPPKDRTEFLRALTAMTKPGSGGKQGQWGFVFTNWESNAYTFMRQFGGEFFTPDFSKCILYNEGNIAALQFCVDIIYKQHAAPEPQNFDAWIGFRQGKVGIVFEGIYMLADLQRQQDLDFAGAPVPQVADHQAVWADSHNLCMRSDLREPELSATWRFIQYLSNNSLDWAAGGQIPVRKSLRAEPRFKEMAVQSAFAEQIPIVQYLPRVPFIFEFQTELDLAIEQALRKRATPAEALKGAEARINQIIRREGSDSEA